MWRWPSSRYSYCGEPALLVAMIGTVIGRADSGIVVRRARDCPDPPQKALNHDTHRPADHGDERHTRPIATRNDGDGHGGDRHDARRRS